MPAPPWYDGSSWAGQIRAFNDGGQPATFWYFLRDGKTPGSGYFVGYGSISKQLVGFMGRQGFQGQMPSAEELFPIDDRRIAGDAVEASYYSQRDAEPWMEPYCSGMAGFPAGSSTCWRTMVWRRSNLLQRSTRLVLKQAGLISAGRLYRGLPAPVKTDSETILSQIREFLAVRTKDRILVLDPGGKLVSSLAISAEFPRKLRVFRAAP